MRKLQPTDWPQSITGSSLLVAPVSDEHARAAWMQRLVLDARENHADQSAAYRDRQSHSNEHLPPLGLLAVGGPLIDAGFKVRLIDAEFGPLPLVEIARRVQLLDTDVVLIGHSGSSTAHPTVVELGRLLKLAMPELTIVYGGVHPTYHWDEILQECADIDIIVRGEGEETARQLMDALANGTDLDGLHGIAFRRNGETVATPRGHR